MVAPSWTGLLLALLLLHILVLLLLLLLLLLVLTPVFPRLFFSLESFFESAVLYLRFVQL